MSAETSCIIVATANPALVRTLTLHETGEHDLLRAWHAFADHKHRQLRSIAVTGTGSRSLSALHIAG
jgi:hypothetical protein